MIIGMGNALTDILVKLPDERILNELGIERGGMYLIDEQKHHRMMEIIRDLPQSLIAGGSAANAISGIAGLGLSSKYIGHIGNDATGKAFAHSLESYGITSLLGISETTHSGKCISLVFPDGERTMLTYLGAALEVDDRHLASQYLKGSQVLFIEGYLLNSPDVIEPAMQAAKANGLRVALDAASFTVIREFHTYAKSLIERYVDILFANEDEAEALSGLRDPEAALEELAHSCELVVVKIGAKGSLVACGPERHRIGVIDAVPVDKTGAGDLYAAGFLYGMAKGLNLKQCGEIGAVISSKSIESIGAKIPDSVWPLIKQLVDAIESGQPVGVR